MSKQQTTNGKGSKPRPLAVSYETYGNNYDSIFRKKKNWVIANPEWKVKIRVEEKSK